MEKSTVLFQARERQLADASLIIVEIVLVVTMYGVVVRGV
jgi:hypothetical protein